jgi:hypothetical protein
MKIIESSLCIRDGTDVIHKENVKGDVFLFSRLKATLPSYAGYEVNSWFRKNSLFPLLTPDS